ncbi:MAG: flagellar biosynthetic protein FliO, partial [Rhodospirillaceae bacterium]|nr:flagellar biosynthetic protein FliO [Rhodospirillaceae bacterium]
LLIRLLFGARLRSGGRSRQPRLGVVDAYDLDRHRQLVIVRRDNVEHVVLVGPNTSQVIETGIPVPADAGEPPPQGFTAFSQFLPKDKDQ